MDKKKTVKMINTTSTHKKSSQDDFNINKKNVYNNNFGSSNNSINNKNSINHRSKSNLSAKDKHITNGLKSNV